jgi:hypothetical protein
MVGMQRRRVALIAAGVGLLGCGGGNAMPSGSAICADEEEGLVARMALQPLENGIRAALYPSRPRYPASQPVDVTMDLANSDGTPLVGRVLEALVVDPTGTDPQAIQLALAEEVDRPSRYSAAIINVPQAWPFVTVLVTVSETGLVKNPGVIGLAQVIIDHSAPAALDGHVTIGPQPSPAPGRALTVVVNADRAGYAIVDITLAGGATSSTGRLRAAGPLTSGPNRFMIAVPEWATGTLSVPRAALQVDGRCADLRLAGLPVVAS